MNHFQWEGYLRKDGRKGIRNYIVVVYNTECAHHVARAIASPFKDHPVQLINMAGSNLNDNSDIMMNAICMHPNVGAVLLVASGSEGFDFNKLEGQVNQSGRPVNKIVIQEAGGTQKAIDAGLDWVDWCLGIVDIAFMVPMTVDDLIIGTISGGSDATTGVTANPALGRACDKLISNNATVIFQETGEMIGLEAVLIDRAANPAISEHLKRSLENAASNYRLIDNESIVPGNASGYLTTDAEKSMSIYCKVGGSQISGLIKPGEKPSRPGLYLMDVNPGDKSVRALVSKNVSVGIVEMIASGCHMIIFTTGSGSVVGSAISPVIKICSNPQTYERMKGDMDINAGDILHGEITIEKMGNNICDGILAVAAGIPTCSEGMGHQEFMLT